MLMPILQEFFLKRKALDLRLNSSRNNETDRAHLQQEIPWDFCC